MILFVVGEDPTDVGSESYEGDIPLLLANVLARRFGCRRATLGELPRTHRGFGAKLIAAVHLANAQSPPTGGVVFVIDCPLHRHGVLRKELAAARDSVPILPMAIGLAIHEIEAWLLADPEARRAGMDMEASRHSYPRPEEDQNPKATYAGLLGEARARASSVGAVDTDDFERRRLLIAALRPDVVANLCPTGFDPFLKNLRPFRGT